MNRARRELEKIVRRYTTAYAIDTTAKGHYRVRLIRGDQSRVIIAAGTTASRDAIPNFEAEVRRALRALEEV